MVKITDKHLCSGCESCVQSCPKNCISFEEDCCGFRYPKVDETRCVKCGKCLKVCPVQNPNKVISEPSVYAAINPNETERMKSSSGGLFVLLAKEIINRGGVVFGAKFDEDWNVIHSHAETLEGIEPLCGSKYVQSRIGCTYIKVKEFLSTNRYVLFVGTPCQVAGLKLFLGKDYDSLYTVEIACHGVPSPLLWRKYIDSIITEAKQKGLEVCQIFFRDKMKSWREYNFVIKGKSANNTVEIYREIFNKNKYMQTFLYNLSLRPSCYKCPAKSGKSGSDIILADFWSIQNINPQYYDNKGTSLLLLNTEKGNELVSSLNLKLFETSYANALACNPVLMHSVTERKEAALFWELFKNQDFKGIRELINKCQPGKIDAIKSLIKKLILKVKNTLK